MKISKACFSRKLKIKKGDKIRVVLGKDKGREGTVEKTFPKENKILVAGINIAKKHTRATQGRKGGIIDIVVPLSIAKVAPICPKCGKITRFGFLLNQKEKVRICRKCQEVI